MGAYEERIGNPAFEQRVRVAREVDAAFASRMRQAREELSMSQTMLANKLRNYGIHIDGTAITRIEKNVTNDSGARSIRLAEAVAISDALGKPLDAMLRTSPPLSEQMRIIREQLAAAAEAAEYAHMRRVELQHKLRELERQQERIDQLRDAVREAMGRGDAANAWNKEAYNRLETAAQALTTTREMTTNRVELAELESDFARAESDFADSTIALEKATNELNRAQAALDEELRRNA